MNDRITEKLQNIAMKKKIFFILLISILSFEHSARASGGGSPPPAPTPPAADNDPGMPALCTMGDGSTTSMQGKMNDKVVNNRVYQTWKLHKNSDGSFINGGDASFDSAANQCGAMGGELDPDAMAIQDPNNFGTGPLRDKNTNIISGMNNALKLSTILFTYITDAAGNPARLFQKDTGKYSVIELDSSGKISDSSLQNLSTIQLSSPLNIPAILEKAQEIASSGKKKIDVDAVKAQLAGIQELSKMYRKNLSNVTNWLADLSKLSYDDLSKSIQSISEYLQSVTVGDADIANQKLKDIVGMYKKLIPTLNNAKIVTDRARPVFDAMTDIAKKIPGADPEGTENMVLAPEKYTIIQRLISDSVGGNQSTLRIFYYIVREWMEKMTNFGNKISQLQSTKGNFVPLLDSNISKLTLAVSNLVQIRSNFEATLSASAKTGPEDTDGKVHAAYTKLQNSIENAVNTLSKLQSDLGSKKNITDPNFQNAIAAQNERLAKLIPSITEYQKYEQSMPDLVKNSYQKAQNKHSAPLDKTIKESNINMDGLKKTLQPVLDKITAQQDATADWKNSQSNMTYYVENLTKNSKTLADLLQKEQDSQTKNLIARQQTLVQTALDNQKVVEQRVGLSGINQDVIGAKDIIKQLTPVSVATMDPHSIQAATVQYDKDKSPIPLIQKYTELFELIRKLRANLLQDIVMLKAMDQNDLSVKTLLTLATQLSGAKIVPGSMCAFLQSYGFLPLNARGLSAQIQAIP